MPLNMQSCFFLLLFLPISPPLRKLYHFACAETMSLSPCFSAVKGYASKNGTDEFAAPLTSQLFFKTSHLSYDYVQHPLYTKEQINKLAETPKILFHAMKKAQEVKHQFLRVD